MPGGTPKWVVILAAAAVGAGGLWWWFADRGREAETIAVRMPTLSPAAQAGQAPYIKHCGECHGDNGGGATKGPPLIHRYYEPGHHGDAAFAAAITRGARQHHWRFGDMKAIPGVTEAEIPAIIAFVREVQRANGIR